MRKMAEGGSHDCESQKNEIVELLKTPLKKGDTWFLVDSKWFKQWKKYVGYDSWDTSYVGDESAYPGPVDNCSLYKEGSTELLREHLIDELDYVLVPEAAWDKLVTWNTLTDAQVPVSRKVIEHGMFVKHCKVEVYLMDLKLCPNKDLANVVTKHFSRADTIDEIESEMRRVFHIEDQTDVRLWNKYMTNTYEHLNKLDNTVQDVGLYPGQLIVIEEKNEDGSWPRQTKTTGAVGYSSTRNQSENSSQEQGTSNSSSRSTSASGSYSNNYYGSGSSSYYSSNYGDSYGGSSSQAGLCGLSNLGNTCFMNSALQCMSNVPVLTDYMLTDQWKAELNYDNPLGMKGEIASSYAELVKNIWSGKYSYTMPRAFKMAVGRFAPQFSGYQQQDAQELMAFLLDGLHEDLNRIKNKPYIEQKDADGRADELVAKEAWENYRKRNDSVITDTFHGLLKSTLICPDCRKVSVTFDPFCYLSLPLPYKKERNIKVVLVSLDPSRVHRQYKLTVPSQGVVSDLCRVLSKQTSIQPDKLVVTDVYNHRLHKVFSNDEALSHILDRDDIYVYEVPVSSSDDSETHVVPVYLRERREAPSYNNYSHVSTSLFGLPLLVPVPRQNCTYEVLYNCVMDRMARYVRAPDENEEWWKPATEPVNGEVEMDEGFSDNAEVNGQKTSTDSSEEDDSNKEGAANTSSTSTSAAEPSKGNDNDDEDDDEEDRWVKDKLGRPRLFKFSVINSYGNAEMDSIKDNDTPIKFTGRMYLAIDWHTKAKDLFYNESAAEECTLDDTVERKQKKQSLQLTECLDLFTTREQLGKQDPWYCPACKEFRQATKKFDLWQLPHILVIHLKRFQYNRLWRDKLDAFVEYPTRGLNMQKWIINSNHGPAVYDLLGVVNHYGGMGGGHYTAYCRNKDEQWYHFDDSSVSATSEDSTVTKAGYVLVYQRREPPPESSQVSSTITSASQIIANGNIEEMEVN